MIPRPLAWVIVGVVTVVWAVNALAAIVIDGWQSDPAINFVFAAIVGGTLGLKDSGGNGVLSRLIGALRPPPTRPPDPPAPPTHPPGGQP